MLKRENKYTKKIIKPEENNMESVLLDRRFVVTVKSGGKSRKMSVTFCVVYNDSKNKKRIGIGSASAKNFIDARDKAIKSAQKSLISMKMNKNGTLYHDISADYHGTSINLFHVKVGIKASPVVHKMFKLLGLNATCKINTRSKNTINIARAVLSALSSHESIYDIADRCGKTYDEILSRKMCVRSVNNEA